MNLKTVVSDIAHKTVRRIFYPIHCRRMRKKYGNINDLTILSDNCMAGEIYNVLGSRFSTPLINTSPEDENFIKLCKNPDRYFAQDAEPYVEKSDEPNPNASPYPLMKVDDVIIRAAHYKNIGEACEGWNRRRTRVTSKRCIIANTWDLHDNMDLINELLAIDLPKLIFTDLQQFSGRKEFVILDKNKYYKDKRGKVRPNIADFHWYTWRFEEAYPEIYEWVTSI